MIEWDLQTPSGEVWLHRCIGSTKELEQDQETPGERFQRKEEVIDLIVEKQLRAKGITRPPVPCHFANSYAPVQVRLFNWKRLHGAIAQHKGTLLIGLNRNDNSEERRFTLFHEIAHFVLEQDRQLIGGVFFRSGRSRGTM